jgi:hypothetical protein
MDDLSKLLEKKRIWRSWTEIWCLQRYVKANVQTNHSSEASFWSHLAWRGEGVHQNRRIKPLLTLDLCLLCHYRECYRRVLQGMCNFQWPKERPPPH